MDHNDAERLARGLMEDHGLEGWSFQWDRALKRFGFCRYDRKVISLSWYLVGLNEENDVRDTILHEIAHALAPRGANHDVRWQAMAIAIGCNGMACYDGTKVAQPKAAWIGTCPCGETIKRQRRKSKLYHVKCGGDFTWRRND